METHEIDLPGPAPMRYLSFDLSDNDEGVTTLEALASTSTERHAAVMAEVEQVLGWAWRHFPYTHGPADDGMDWDHDLQVNVEGGQWHAVTLTLTGSPRFIEAFFAAFGGPSD
jgi:hypothetical protein